MKNIHFQLYLATLKGLLYIFGKNWLEIVLDGFEEAKKTFHASVPLRPSFFIIYFMFSTCYMTYFYMEYMAKKGLVGATVSEISILGKLPA